MTRPRRHLSPQALAGWSLALLAAVGPRVHVHASPNAASTAATSGAARSASGAPSAAPPTAPATMCPSGMFPDDGACVHIPDDDAFGEDPVGAPEQDALANGHFEKNGRWTAYEQIPRRPERPADYDAYLYPIAPGLPGGKSVVSGYDLDLPDTQQRRGRMHAVGHGAVDLPQKRGTPIRLVPLEHQVGDAEVLFVGTLMGTSVVTHHVVREGGRNRDYVLIFGHLDHAAPDLIHGSVLKANELVGFVGDTGSPELVHLHLEARRLREGIDAMKLERGQILAREVSIVCDPRNVLPLRNPAARP